ncbi:MAG: maleylacetoacetate isomerase [Rhodospirillaceae bacterium]|nr:maleylacetoacetate isomerase [Rhodospirillaceae bacterium]
MLTLHGYYRSSAAYRVRIALNLKGLDHRKTFIHLRNGHQFSAAYAELNPQQQVPTLETDGGDMLVQSSAIIEWLEETWPEPPLLPADALGRQRVRALAAVPGCDIHPIGNLRVLKYLQEELGQGPDAVAAWARHWIELGFAGLERMLAEHPATGRFCHGDAPTMADLFLVPQAFNAERFNADMDKFPTVARISAACNDLEAFAAAAPGNQDDAE